MQDNQIISNILSNLEDHKGSDIKVYHDQKIADHVIVVSSESNKHAKALADFVTQYLKSENFKYHIEGYKESNWVLIDTFNIIIHVFKSDVREYYQIDELLNGEIINSDNQN
jgi:ribosome-associated protein